MTSSPVPAPPWRRLAASVYDSFLLFAVWVIPLSLELAARQWFGLERNIIARQALLFAAGLAFFGWFWTHGGQTLGMRAWRLQVRRANAAALRWPVAALRYSVMLLSWGVVLAPLLLLAPRLAERYGGGQVASLATLMIFLALLLMLLDPRRRAPCDWVSGTEVVLLPKPGL